MKTEPNKSSPDVITTDLNLLVVFELLFREQSATRAAEKLGISQSAVSASLRRLRDLYDDQLFLRTPHGLRPSVKAELLFPIIEDALKLVRRSLSGSEINSGTHDLQKIVSIGLSDDIEIAFGTSIIRRIQQDLPYVRLVFRQTNSLVATSSLLEGDIDLAITTGIRTDNRIKHTTVGHSNYLCVQDGMRNQALTMEDYLIRQHLLVSYSGVTGIVDDVLAEKGLKRRIIAATSHFSAIPYLLTGTDLIATLPSHAAQAMQKLVGLECSPCPIDFPSYAINLNWRFDLMRQEVIRQVRDLIEGVFDEQV